MTQPNATCPPALERKDTNAGLALCYKRNAGCNSTVYSTLGLSYSQVCGQIRGYQFGTTDAFGPYFHENLVSINDIYVDGVHVVHIWTFGLGHVRMAPATFNVLQSSNIQSPPFVKNHYYCESGWMVGILLYSQWMGESSVVVEKVPYSQHALFNRTYETTTENIELRMCTNGRPDTEDTPHVINRY